LNTTSVDTEDDQSLEQNAENFAAGLGADELGILHMFADLNIDQEDDFFFEGEAEPVAQPDIHPVVQPVEEKKKLNCFNVFQEHLKRSTALIFGAHCLMF
jgi:hypothetical protein